MSRRLIRLALGVLLLANGFALAMAALNRRGDAEATLELSGRELRIIRGDDENSGVMLDLETRSPIGEDERDSARLEALGFDPAAALAAASRGRRFRSESRPGFVVLEYEGPTWQRTLAQSRTSRGLVVARAAAGQADSAEVASAERDLAWEENGASRLFVVDAGPSADALRASYPDRRRYAVAHAVVSMWIQPPAINSPGGVAKPLLTVSQVLPQRLHVPLPYRRLLENLSSPGYEWQHGEHPGRGNGGIIRAIVPYGKRLEPWVSDLVVDPAPAGP